MKKILLAIMLCVISFSTSASASAQQQAESPRTGNFRFSLEECFEYAMGNSYVRRQMELSQQSAALTYEQSKMDRLPNLSASASENFSHSKAGEGSWNGSYGVSTGVTIFQGGNLNQTIKQNEILVGQMETRTAQYDNTMTINILNSFFSILGYEELLKYQNALISESEAQVNDGKQRLNFGTILPSDYLMLESQWSSNLNSINETQINLENELLKLKGLLSMEMDAGLSIINPDTTAFMSLAILPLQDSYLNVALQSLPDIELLNYGVEIAESNLMIAKTSYMPTLSLSAGISTGHSQNFQNWGTQISDRFGQNAGISLSIPIFNKGRTKTSVAKNRISLQQAELDRQQGILDLKQTLIQNYRNAESALSRYQMLKVKEEAYRETLRVYNEQFNEGQIKPVDLLQQQNNYINVMYEYVQGKYGFMLRRKMLDVYMGLPITM